MSRKRKIGDHYEPRISPTRESYSVLDWASARTQRKRFEILADSVPLEGRSLLDVGCGLGDLWAFLLDRKIRVEYTGVDILDKMIAEARRRHPQAHFLHADLFVANPFGPRSFDVVFASGIFNLSLGNNVEFIAPAARTLLDLCRSHLVFNMLHSRSPRHDQTYFHYDPRHVQKLLAPLGCHVRVLDDYLPNDFTVICTR